MTLQNRTLACGERNLPARAGQQFLPDEENAYFAFGPRTYSPATGRFLSPDPLWESFRNANPYHYCFNNPISHKDPSGLAPEKEKSKEDELQRTEDEYEKRLREYMFLQECYRIEAAMLKALTPDWLTNGSYGTFEPFNSGISYIAVGGGPGGGDGNSGKTGSSNGSFYESLSFWTGTIWITEKHKEHIRENMTVNNFTQGADCDYAVELFMSYFFEAHSCISHDIYEFLISGSYEVDILTQSDFQEFSATHGSKDAGGWCSYYSDGHLILRFSIDILSDIVTNWSNTYKVLDNNSQEFFYNAPDIISHEFGHAYAYYTFGKEYTEWNKDYQENWSTYYCNTVYRQNHGRPFEQLVFTGIFYWLFTKGHNPSW